MEKRKKREYTQIFPTRPVLTLDPRLNTQYKKIKLHTIQISRTLTSKKSICKPNWAMDLKMMYHKFGFFPGRKVSSLLENYLK